MVKGQNITKFHTDFPLTCDPESELSLPISASSLKGLLLTRDFTVRCRRLFFSHLRYGNIRFSLTIITFLSTSRVSNRKALC